MSDAGQASVSPRSIGEVAPGIDRRRVLSGLGASLLAGAAGRSALAAPALVPPELTPQMFGATGRDPALDREGWNRAVAEAASTGRAVVARGTYLLGTSADTRWHSTGRTGRPVHIAVDLRSGTTIHGRDARILVVPPENPDSKGDSHFIFGTGLNPTPGTLRDIAFDGLDFDFSESAGEIPPYTYAVGCTGVDNLVRRNMRLFSTNRIKGRGLLAENIRGRRDENITHVKIQQGIYTRHEHDVVMRGISFESFVEALDFDGPCWNVQLTDLVFQNGVREGQCIDTGGGSNWLVDRVRADKVGSVIFVYVKENAWPDYADNLKYAGEPTETCVIPQNMTIRNVVASQAGRPKEEALRIGNVTRDKPGFPKVGPPRNITVQNWQQTGGYQLQVNECVDLRMDDIVLDGIAAPIDPVTGASLSIRQTKPFSRVEPLRGQITGVVRRASIRNSAGMGLSAVGTAELLLKDITIDGFNRQQNDLTATGMKLAAVRGGTVPRVEGERVLGAPEGAVAIDQGKP